MMRWISWITFVVGLWLIAAPFALGYRPTTNAMTSDVAAGILVLALAIVREVFTVRHRQRPAHA
jgi:uncharacterized membrane protein HdeD (DUF308 family)